MAVLPDLVAVAALPALEAPVVQQVLSVQVVSVALVEVVAEV